MHYQPVRVGLIVLAYSLHLEHLINQIRYYMQITDLIINIPKSQNVPELIEKKQEHTGTLVAAGTTVKPIGFW